MQCPVCRRSRLVEIDLKISEEPVRMRSCSRCDTRWWERSGELLELDGVLELASSTRR